MPRFIIRWNIGYGDHYDIVECDDQEQADEEAYQAWRDSAEGNADYGVIGEATDELLEDYGLK
jgi:hypothetical protein